MKRLVMLFLSLVFCGNLFGAITFDGTDDIVNYGDAVDLTGDFTIYVRFNSTVLDAGTHYKGFISKRDTYASTEWELFYRGDSTNNGVSFWFGNSGSTRLDFLKILSTNTEYSLILRRNGETFDLFTNGTDKVTLTSSNAIPAGDDSIRLGTLGLDAIGTVGNFNGIMREIAIWSNDLTDSEISNLHNAYLRDLPINSIQTSSLVIYSRIDDQPSGTSADGDSVMDLSGNGNNGTGDDGANNTGLTWSGETVLSYAPNVIHPAFVFIPAGAVAGFSYGYIEGEPFSISR